MQCAGRARGRRRARRAAGGMAGCNCLRGRPALLWTVTLLANFCCALNGGVITLTIPTLAAEFGCSVETAAWVAFAPNFFAAMCGPSLGKAADTFGRSKAWWSGMFMFISSFVICAYSTSIEMMVVGRTLSGIAWATTGPAGFGILASTLERSQRGVASSLQTATGTLGSSIGVALGGLLMDLGSWRLIFILPILPLFSVFLLSLLVLPLDGGSSGTPRKDGRKLEREEFDLAGSIVFALFIGSFLLGVNRGNDVGWGTPFVIALFVASVVLFPTLIVIERRAPNPVLPLSLVRDRVTFAAMSCLILAGVCCE